ncbi:sodium/hydrogen exchanger 9B2-like [Babylonia areolata]|uniref:sodium/hydrogen exchanger 9B2-like n=1 Tax=Babylonia areolata TaxID=304850 RepID=UPI003FD5F948
MSQTTTTKPENGIDMDIEYEIKDHLDKVKQHPEEDPSRCDRCQESCLRTLRPILAEHHPLQPGADLCERFRVSLLCPPHGRIGAALFVVVAGCLFWAVLWAVVDEDALPGGNLFALLMLFFFCWCGGYLMNLCRLPPLLGMLIVGGILGNVPGVDIAKDIHQDWGSGCRQIALAIILIRAGLGLDPKALRRLSFVVLRLSFCPCLMETLTDGIAAYLILGFPWQWGFMLGFIIAAVSPAVVVPSLLSLSDRGYGIDKGIPTLILAAASIDDVLAITGFGVLLGITFSSGDLVWNLFKGPLEAVVGVVVGTVMGMILWYVPQKKSKHLLLFRSALLMGFSLLAVFGSKRAGWSGAGPLAVLTLAFVAALRWRQEMPPGQKNPVEEVVGVLWMLFQPLLFGLIAAAVRIDKLSGDTVGEGVAVLAIGLTVRCAVAFLSVFGTNLNMKERLFVPLAWLPKATVQAAIGAIAYDMAREMGDEDMIEYGEKVLVLAVLVIVITAPIGAVAIYLGGPHLLKQTPHTTSIEVDDKQQQQQHLQRRRHCHRSKQQRKGERWRQNFWHRTTVTCKAGVL